MSSYAVIIVAGGTGTRMGSSLPKQFHNLAGKPILFYSLEAFYKAKTQPDIFLVMHSDYLIFWKDLCTQFKFNIPHEVIAGGINRTESVHIGLKAISGLEKNQIPSWIAVHDAVRPIVSSELIDYGFSFAIKWGNSVPCLPLYDSLREIFPQGSRSISRENIRTVQTPQIFPYSTLLRAYQNRKDSFLDDASLVESTGERIFLSEGRRDNIKITFNQDVTLGEFLIKNRLL